MPSARIYGAELQANAHWGPVSVNGGVAYTDSDVNQQLSLIDSRTPLAGPVDVTRHSLPYAPKWTASIGPTYAIPASFGKFTGTAQYAYTSRAYATLFQAAPIDVLGSHSLINLNVALALNDGIRLEAYSTNLDNSLYAAGTLGGLAAIGGPPRQYGVRLSYTF